MIATRTRTRLPVRVRRGHVVVAACALLALTGCSSSDSGNSSSSTKSAAPPTSASASGSASATGGGGGATTIVIQNFKFVPDSLTVPPGATVTVTNKDSTAHTATASDKSFDTGSIDPGKSKTFTAPKKKGVYDYICTIHQFMKAKLTVS